MPDSVWPDTDRQLPYLLPLDPVKVESDPVSARFRVVHGLFVPVQALVLAKYYLKGCQNKGLNMISVKIYFFY